MEEAERLDPSLRLTEFIAQGGGGELEAGHLVEVDALLENVMGGSWGPGGRARRVIVTMPPRMGKSTRVCWGVARGVVTYPALLNAYCSYSQTLSSRWSRQMRRIVEQCGIGLAPDENRIEAWRTNEGGGLNAVGVQGPLTGFGVSDGGVILLDDLIKDRADAESSQIRNSTWDWLCDVLGPRRDTPNVSIILTATRWHTDDPTGRLLRGEMNGLKEWEHIHLPAIRIDEDGKEQALWPARWPLADLRELRGENGGDRTWNSLYMGNPAPEGATMFGEPTYGEFPLGLRSVA